MNAADQEAFDAKRNVVLSPAQKRHLLLFLLPFVAVPCLILAAALAIVPTPWFTQHSGSSYLANMGYAAKLHNATCDVLIYGDSSAMLSVDPAILQAKTGLSACNIAEFEGVTLMDHTLLVDRFLANNPRPRVILFLYAPEDLNIPAKWPKVSMYEAISFNLQYERNARTAKLLFQHPDEAFGWAELGMRRAIQRARAPIMAPDVLHQRENDRGIFRYEPSVAQSCSATLYPTPPDTAWIADLRSRYGVQGTHVLVDAVPAPTCDPSLDVYRKNLNGVIDNSPYPTLPVTDFLTEGRLHVNATGVEAVSSMVAAQVNALSLAPAGGR